MQRPVITIPYSEMRLTNVDWWIDWRGQSGGDRTGGGTQVIFNAFPRWVGDMSFAHHQDQVGEWRARILSGQGRVGIFRMFMIDTAVFRGSPYFSAWAASGAAGFDPGPQITASSSAAAGADTIRVSVMDPDYLPRVGQIISADDWPMVVTSVAAAGAGTYDLGVTLQRAAISSGDPISLVGTGLFELVEDMGGRASYGANLLSQPSLSVREVLNR